MSVEAIWYSSYRRDRHGDTLPPVPHRMCRRPLREQWEAIIDLAIEIASGDAGWRHATLTLTGERYWYFRADWWLLTERHETRARRIVQAATDAEFGAARANGSGGVDSAAITARVRRWKLSGRWHRIAARVPGLHRFSAAPKLRVIGRGDKKKQYALLP